MMSPSSIPKTKNARRELVAELIEGQKIHSQTELLRLLKKSGVTVTQATLSRDLDELGAIKIRDGDGFLVYALSEATPTAGEEVSQRVARLAQELILSVDNSGDLVVVRTPPGGAHLLAGAIDRLLSASAETSILGTVAGDDTVLIIVRGDSRATSSPRGRAVAQALRKIAEGAVTTEALATSVSSSSQQRKVKGTR
jgi:transcriptional regulator of arginine metabolism